MKNLTGIPDRLESTPISDYSPESEFDPIASAMDSTALDDDASWVTGDPLDAIKPVVTSQYIDSLRPGSLMREKLSNDLDKANKKLGDINGLLSLPASILFDPVHAETWKLSKPTETERKKQMQSRRKSTMDTIGLIKDAIKEAESKVAAHDAGVKWVPAKQRDKTGPEAKTRLDIHARYMNGDVPVEEFSSNPSLIVKKKADTSDKKITNFFGAPDHIGGNASNVEKQLDELTALALKGQRSKHWYDYTSKIIKMVTRGNSDEAKKLAGALAITSANNALDGNLSSAIKAYNTYRMALITGKHIPIKSGHGTLSDFKLEGMLYGNHHTVGGRKVNNFFNNMMKGVDTSLAQGVTNDLWMKRIFGYDIDSNGDRGAGNKDIRDDQYSYMQNMITLVADKLSQQTGTRWTPDQVQAALWTAGREAQDADKKIKTRSKKIGNDLEDMLVDNYANHESRLDDLRTKVNEAFKNGDISADHVTDYGNLIDGLTDSVSDDPLGIRDGLTALNSKLNLNNSHIAFSRSRENERAKDQILRELAERERERLSRGVGDPLMYDFSDSAHKVLPSALNVNLIPSDNAYDMDGMLSEAPYGIKAQLANELAPIIHRILAHVGIPRAVNGDIVGYGDYSGNKHPLFGIGLNTPMVTSSRSKAPKKAHDQSDNMNKLANALMGYIFRQPTSSYVTFAPARNSLGQFDINLANTSFYSAKTGDIKSDEWRRIVDTRNAICDRNDIHRDEIQIVPATSNGGRGVAFVNHTKMNNEDFQKLTGHIMSGSGLENLGLSFDHSALSNKGQKINEQWTASKKHEPGANYRNEIRRLGGDAAVAYADHVYESAVEPILAKFAKWRELVGREGFDSLEEDYPIRRIYASEPNSRGRNRSVELAERVRDRTSTASRSELIELARYAYAIAHGKSVLEFGMRGVLLSEVCKSIASRSS